jgi:hypothetical protein
MVSRDDVRQRFENKNVVLVGGGPSAATNPPGFVDEHEVVVRLNKYKLRGGTGRRTDVLYSYFGVSIKKDVDDLRADGVRLCMRKCPDAMTVESSWHRTRNQMVGVDFRYIYQHRVGWWFCDTYIPSLDDFWYGFNLLGGHMTTTGFEALLQIISFNPKSLHLTGFDFFRSRLHNLNDRWRPKKYNDDPVCHVPDRELAWLAKNVDALPITVDPVMQRILDAEKASPSSEEFRPTNFPHDISIPRQELSRIHQARGG